jgi:hypothetical protein
LAYAEKFPPKKEHKHALNKKMHPEKELDMISAKRSRNQQFTGSVFDSHGTGEIFLQSDFEQ